MQGHTKVSLPPRGKSCLQIEHWKAVIDMQAGSKIATADRQACWAEERALGLKKIYDSSSGNDKSTYRQRDPN